MRRFNPVVALAVVCSACGTEPETSRGAAVADVADSAGIEVVSNGREGTLGPLTLRETLRLGVMEGEGPEQFSQIYAVAMNAAGDVFVGDNGSGTVRVFDAEGRFLAELGGRGEGPGEVSMVNDVVASGDTVAIIDWQRGGKVVLYTIDGTLLSSWSVRQADGTRVQPLHPTEQGWLTQVNRPDRRQLSPGEADTLYQEIHLTDFGSTEVGPQVYSIPIYALYGIGAAGEAGRDWSLFRPRTYSGFDAEGQLYVTDDQAYRIDVHDHEGLRRSVRRAYTPRHLEDVDIDELKAAAMHVLDTMSRMPQARRTQQQTQLGDRIDRQASIPLPDVMTPLGGLLVSPDGSFWVQVSDSTTLFQREADQMFGMFGGVPQRETSWDLFDPRGRYLGAVALPPRFRAEAVQGFEVLGVWADEFDIEYVVKYEAVPVG